MKEEDLVACRVVMFDWDNCSPCLKWSMFVSNADQPMWTLFVLKRERTHFNATRTKTDTVESRMQARKEVSFNATNAIKQG